MGGPELFDPWESAAGFAAVWVAHLGRRYGLLRALDGLGRGAGPGEIARLTGLDRKAVGLWCEAAAELGLLKGRRGRYALKGDARALILDDRDHRYVGGLLSYLALRSLDYHLFDALFGRGSADSDGARHLTEAYAEATRWDHLAFFELVVPRVRGLRSVLERGARALDIGCGTGGWAVELCLRYSAASAVGVDPDGAAISVARRRAEEAGLSDRLTFVEGTSESLEFGEEFDLVYLGEVLCVASDRLGVLRSARRALRRGGLLVVAEGLSERTGDSRQDALLRFIALDYALQGGSMLSRRELSSLLSRSGFGRARFVHAGGGLWFAVAARHGRGNSDGKRRSGASKPTG
ncbi:MAG: class I SAM-dependent methyltransferase [Aigarchaeota archaeon]|nr:class I SAM-dependent methyltransferase [Aigarchaeota archaeon]